jgi:hypothetical protein
MREQRSCKTLQKSKQSFNMNQHFYLLEICLWQ